MTDQSLTDDESIERDTVASMAAVIMLAAAEMEMPGAAITLLTDDESPLRDTDTVFAMAAVRTVIAVADMGEVTVADLATFLRVVQGDESVLPDDTSATPNGDYDDERWQS